MEKLEPEILSQNIGDRSIEYLHYQSTGPVVVMLHATGFLPWLWHPIARELAGHYRVIAPYFCSHREAEPEDGGLHWSILAQDLCSFCDTLELEAPLLVGHSMGATIITIASAINTFAASGMILIEPIFLPEQVYTVDLSVEQHPLAAKSIKRLNHWDNSDSARAYLKSKALFRNWDEEMLELYIRHGMIPGESGGLELACHPRQEASLFMGGSHLNPWPLLQEINCPVLVVEGETSGNRQFIDLPYAASLLPHGKYQMVHDAGHLIPMEKPHQVAAMINDFFSVI